MTPTACRTLLVAVLGAIALPALAQQRNELAGEWTVDLRPTPQAPAYHKPMTIAVAADGTLTGAFYEHPIDLGRAGATNGRPCFSFRTQDASGPYQTSSCLVGDHIEGQTWSEGRRFVLTWQATRTRK
ncbi:hypothetical protein [Sphingomonas endophytica]|uniref:Extracellular endo-alpha-(1->5)-L-arabinanase C-terminal domain-containing protein n=1 Tax=Sphingomonas endophytica TaxID=869719 RepID=A0A147HX04_9SPHN|nr:hypothetical protein [Sphingomonas endophytica]KTT69458.1 hypothetical protein NS334_14575 [Sphingomonas endophytica]